MKAEEIRAQLEDISRENNFSAHSATLTEAWLGAGVGAEAIQPVLRFIENNPSIDFGAPGPLVHFVERFYRRGYEEELVDSVRRKPVSVTVSMLNAVINGARELEERVGLIAVMREVELHPLADESTVRQALRYLGRHEE